MLDQLEKAFPATVKEVVPKVVSVLKLTDILGRLVEEEISVRDLRGILQAIAENGQTEADSVMLTEHVRSSLKRYVSHKYARGTNTLVVYLLDPQIEEAIRASIKRTSAGTHLALEPDIAQEIVQAVKNECGHLPPTAQRPVILTAMDIRRYVRKLLEYEFNPPFSVVSYQELSPELNIQPVARISLPFVTEAKPTVGPPMTRFVRTRPPWSTKRFAIETRTSRAESVALSTVTLAFPNAV